MIEFVRIFHMRLQMENIMKYFRYLVIGDSVIIMRCCLEICVEQWGLKLHI